jgi:hypothetical protein
MIQSVITILRVTLVLLSDAVDYFRKQALVTEGKTQQRTADLDQVDRVTTTATTAEQESTKAHLKTTDEAFDQDFRRPEAPE